MSIVDNLCNSLFKRYNEPREGVHISDLTFCMRKSVFNKLEQPEITWKSLNHFFFGQTFHLAVQHLLESDPNRYEMEKEVKMGDVVGHIDLYDKIDNVVYEIKTSRSKPEYVTKPSVSHVNQIKYYMALTGARRGFIMYMLLNVFDDKPFRLFSVSMNDIDHEIYREELRMRAEKFRRAVEFERPELASHIMNIDNMNWLCRDCIFKDRCQDINGYTLESMKSR